MSSEVHIAVDNIRDEISVQCMRGISCLQGRLTIIKRGCKIYIAVHVYAVFAECMKSHSELFP